MQVTNRFKGLDLVDRVSEELWTEVGYIVQKVVIKKPSPRKKKCKQAKWLPEEALQIVQKRRKVKGEGEKENIPIWLQSSKEWQGDIRKPS